jgi:hypothetical protein
MYRKSAASGAAQLRGKVVQLETNDCQISVNNSAWIRMRCECVPDPEQPTLSVTVPGDGFVHII